MNDFHRIRTDVRFMFYVNAYQGKFVLEREITDRQDAFYRCVSASFQAHI